MGQALFSRGKLLSELLLTMSGELCPFCLGKPHRHRMERHQGCGLPVKDACFAHVLSMLERSKGMQECVRPDAPPRGGLFLHLSPLTCQSWCLFQVIPLASPAAWPGGPRSVHWERHLVHLSVCTCFCVLTMSALYHCQSIRQNTNISMENCISSLKFSSLSAHPMWELTNSSHLKFGQCPGVFSLRIPHWKCHY